MTTIKQKRFLVLEADKKKNDAGFDIECAIDDDDYDYEYLKDEFSVGRVVKVEMEGKKTYATCEFKITGESKYIENINNEEGFLDKCAIVPKGKGAVKNQIVQDDYELYGFNLILNNESAFIEEVAEAVAKA